MAAYTAPSNIKIQGQEPTEFPFRVPSIDGEPFIFIRADMERSTTETLSRRMQVDWGLSPTGPWTTTVDTDEGFVAPGTTYRTSIHISAEGSPDIGVTLQPDTTYHYRLYAQRTNGTKGPYAIGSVITPYIPDQPTTSEPANESDIPIAFGEQTFEWNYNDQGNSAQNAAYFQWRVAATSTTPAGNWNRYYGDPNGFPYTTDWWTDYCWPLDQLWNSSCPKYLTDPGPGFWAPEDEDDPDSPMVFYTYPPGSIKVDEYPSGGTTALAITLPLTLFPLNSRIEWQVMNVNRVWGSNEFELNLHPSTPSSSRYFTVIGPTSPPILEDPTNNESEVVSEEINFSWRFRDPILGTEQKSAAIQYREAGTFDWTVLEMAENYFDEDYTLAANTLDPSTRYEWQARTTNDRGEVSDWSTSAFFWGIVAPGSGLVDPVVGEPLGALGCGTHRVFIYDRGGEVRRGEVGKLTRVIWERRRDDISEASIVVNNWDEDCGELLANTHTWMHEMVIFRTNEQGVMERVWEGPISRITYKTNEVEIHAKDVMNYVYRRVMRQGYDDHYRLSKTGVQLGLKTVIFRASKIITNALSYDDPNIIPYMTLFEFDDDARESRVVEAYSKTAWEEVDDLAATAGLDYTTVGRRIILNDTHRQIGLLPEMRDGDFSDDPIVSEYGMSLANYFAVTNNAGVYGEADRFVNGVPLYYGFIEQLASAYGEAEGAANETVLTPAALLALQQTLSEQAERNISGRHPAPVIVRVPDNTTLNPDVPVGINQLVPGVWVPVRSVGTLREVAQMQKLDAVRITEEKGLETITVTLSPAPGQHSDDEPVVEE